MKKGLRPIAVLGIIAVMSGLLIGCAAEKLKGDAVTAGEIALTGLAGGERVITVDEIKKLEPFEGHVEGADSQGNVIETDIKGGRLSELLALYGINQTDLNGIRLTASDGYSIEVPHEILARRDVILAYETDGQPLDKDNAPVHVFIPEERAMYWVRMLSKIEVIEAALGETATGVTIMESAYDKNDYTDFELNGQTYAALDTRKILADGTGADTVRMLAADGLEKNETLENFYKGVIQLEGENAPQFASDTLPIGMSVKKLLVIQSGTQAFYFLSSAEATDGSVSLEKIAKDCGLAEADAYVLRFDDGGEKTVTPEELKTLAVGPDGEMLTEDAQKNPKLISIQLF